MTSHDWDEWHGSFRFVGPAIPATPTPAPALAPTPAPVATPTPAPATGRPWDSPGTHAGQEIIGPDGRAYVWVPRGEFMMGSDDGRDDEKPAHLVRITRGFWIGKHEVTNAHYRAFCAATGRAFPSDSDRGDDHPVVYVDWSDAKAYCDHYGLRLPTEAEWEYAARGPEGRKYPWGNEWEGSKLCWWDNRGPSDRTFPVGSFPDGASWVGALDMAGNVWEWCADWHYHGYYRNSPTDDPPGPAAGSATSLHGPTRVLRGGSWVDDPDDCRSARRTMYTAPEQNRIHGFRCAVSPR